MSFILDALKKSEAERQQQTGGEFSNVPSSSGEAQSPRWLWILAILLLFNIAILVGLMLRPDKPPAVVEDTRPAAIAPQQPAPSSFEERIAQVKADRPATAVQPAASTAIDEPDRQPPVVATMPAAANPARVRTLDELRLDGTLQLPELHLDIHVYADDPADRFVFINMAKHRQNSTLAEGPVVSEITAEGVILEYQGHTFLLPRE